MTSVSYLAEAGSYNAVTLDPFQGVCGLNLYIHRKENVDDIRRNLQRCMHFIEVFNSIDDQNKALKLDSMIYFGLIQLFSDAKEIQKWKEKINFVSKTIALVLESMLYPEKKQEINIDDIKKSINILLELRYLAEKKLPNPDDKIFYQYY